MDEKDMTNVYNDELTKLEYQEQKKIEKFKKEEERRKKKEQRKLEKQEDREFARKQKMSREARLYEKKNISAKFSITLLYKISIVTTSFFTICYLLYSIIRKQIYIFNAILFSTIMISWILSATIKKKEEKQISFVITSLLCILWMFLHL